MIVENETRYRTDDLQGLVQAIMKHHIEAIGDLPDDALLVFIRAKQGELQTFAIAGYGVWSYLRSYSVVNSDNIRLCRNVTVEDPPPLSPLERLASCSDCSRGDKLELALAIFYSLLDIAGKRKVEHRLDPSDMEWLIDSDTPLRLIRRGTKTPVAVETNKLRAKLLNRKIEYIREQADRKIARLQRKIDSLRRA